MPRTDEKRKAPKLSRPASNPERQQDLDVESAATAVAPPPVKTATQPPAYPQPPKPVQQATTKRTFRWGVEDDKELVDALDDFNRKLPAGAKRLKMEHLGRAMRKHFVEAKVQELLATAHKEITGK